MTAAMLDMFMPDDASAIETPIAAPKQKFCICDDASAGWFLDKLAGLQERETRLKSQFETMIAGIAAERKSLTDHFGPQLEMYAREQIAIRYKNRQKSLPLLQGTVAFKLTPASVRIADKAAALAYAVAESPELVLTETVTTTTLDSAGYRKLFEATGDADMPGIEIIPARESMTIKFPSNDAKEATK